LLGLVFILLLAVTVAEAMQAIGALLVFALLLLPAAISHRLTMRPYIGLGLAVFFALILTWLGLTIGFYSGLPSSVCISLLAFVAYVVVVGSSALWQRLVTRPTGNNVISQLAESSIQKQK
jgi:zinc/manganese transport system permease protein